MQTIYIKNNQVFYSQIDGSEVIYLPDSLQRSFVVELDPRVNPFFEMPLEELKELQKYNIKPHRSIERENGVMWNGILCDASKESQNDYNSLILQLQISATSFPKQFKFKDENYREITTSEFQEMITTVAAFVASLYEKESQLFAQIDAAQNANDVIAVKW